MVAQFKAKLTRILLAFLFTSLSISVFLGYNLQGNPSAKDHPVAATVTPAEGATDYAMSEALARKLPVATVVPRLVHYLWCGNRTFEFRHYLSIRSAVYYINPDRVVFYYEHLPPIDRFYYNTWLVDLQEEIPSMELQKVGETECLSEERRLRFIHRSLAQDGGIYLGENTLLLNAVWKLLRMGYHDNLSSSADGFIVMSRTVSSSELRGVNLMKTCSPASNITLDSLCVTTPTGLYPKDLWHMAGLLGSIARSIVYGQETNPMPLKDQSRKVPQIAHMLWLHGRDMDFLFYLSCLSLLYVVNVDCLFIHGNMEPGGNYWNQLKQHQRVKFIHRPLPNVVFNQISHRPHHMSDIFRAEVMFKYGGIYSDVDAIWTQPISDDHRSCDATAAYDWAKNYRPYPAYLNLGVSIAKPKSIFWKKVWQSMKHFKDDIFGFNGLLQPYKVYERNPRLLCVDRRLQIMCYMGNCYPLWDVDYKTMDWQKETHAFHFVYPTPAEFTSKEILLNSTGLWADIGKFVLKSAGLID